MSLADAVQHASERLPIHGFVKPEWATTYAARHLPSYEHIAQTVQRYLPPGARVLDFGAGMCDKTAIVSLLGYRCTAYDDFKTAMARDEPYRNAVLAFAKSVGIEVSVAEGGPVPFAPATFDMVMTHHTLEHLHDSPREVLNDLVEVLKPGGLLFVTVPSAVNIRKRVDVLFGRTNLPRFDAFYWYPGPWRGHIREYTAGDLRLLARYLGMEQLELHGTHDFLSVVPRRLRPLYLAVTAVFPGWRDSWCLVARKPADWKPRREVPQDILDPILSFLNR
jgi:SAM-dependent methyltransferase